MRRTKSFAFPKISFEFLIVQFSSSSTLSMKTEVTILYVARNNNAIGSFANLAHFFELLLDQFVKSFQLVVFEVQPRIPINTTQMHPNSAVIWLILKLFFCEFVQFTVSVIQKIILSFF